MTTETLAHRAWSAQFLGHPLVWLGVTVAMILTGYLWISSLGESPVSDPVRKVVPEDFPRNVQQADELIRKEESMNITRASDMARAEEYLQQEAIDNALAPHMERAESLFEQGQLVQPPNDNAWDAYQAALAIDPDYNAAKSGLNRIRNYLIDNAEIAIETGELEAAENWLVQLDVIQPGDEIQADLRDDISVQVKLEAEARLKQQEEEERASNITNSLAQAREAESDYYNNYNKIRDLYTRVLELEPDNEEAIEGLARLADYHLDRAESALRQGELDGAGAALEAATNINPENQRLSALELALAASVKQREQEQAAAEKAARQVAEQEAAQAPTTVATPEPTMPDEPAETTGAASTESTGTPPETPVETVPETAPTPSPEELAPGIQAYYDGDYNRAFELLHPLAEEGSARAQFRIGIMYRYGRSVAINEDLADKWFTRAIPDVLRAAQQGVPWAQTDLGTAYEMGISLQQNYERAAYWYQRAAEQGYSGAQTNLGVLYATGDGVTYDRPKAVYWLKEAARQGDVVAQENLKIMGVSN